MRAGFRCCVELHNVFSSKRRRGPSFHKKGHGGALGDAQERGHCAGIFRRGRSENARCPIIQRVWRRGERGFWDAKKRVKIAFFGQFRPQDFQSGTPKKHAWHTIARRSRLWIGGGAAPTRRAISNGAWCPGGFSAAVRRPAGGAAIGVIRNGLSVTPPMFPNDGCGPYG